VLPLVVTVTHAAEGYAVHAQLGVAVTTKLPPPPSSPTLIEAADSENVHGAAACLTVNVCRATTIVEVRSIAASLGRTEYPTLPEPVPDADEVKVTSGSL
jgi:hypothetical protein